MYTANLWNSERSDNYISESDIMYYDSHEADPKLTKSPTGPGPDYRQTSNMKRTKSQHLNFCRLVLQLSLPNPVELGVRSRMKM